MTILHQIHTIISAWDNKRSIRFMQFVSSPFFNEHENITKLAEALIIAQKKQWNEFSLWDDAFPNETLLPYQKHRLSHAVLSLIESFIIVEENLKDFPHNRKILIKHYLKTQQKDFANLEIEKYGAALNESLTFNKEHLKQVLEWEELRLTHYWQFERRGNLKRNVFTPLINTLDYYYYIYRLEVCTYLQYFQSIQHADEVEQIERFIPNTLSLIEQNPHILKAAHAKAYYYIVKMYHESIDFSMEIIAIIEENEAVFKVSELTNIFTHLRSFHIFKAQKGNTLSLTAINSLYQTCIEKGWVYNANGNIMVSIFLNYIQFKILLDVDSQDINHFINTYKAKLKPNYETNTLLIAAAIQAFSKADYALVIQNVRSAHIPDVMVGFQVRRLEIKTYFEMGDIDRLVNSLNTFRVFIQRCKNIQAHILRANRNFISEVRRIIDCPLVTPQIRNEAIERMKKMDFLVEYWWLKDKWQMHGGGNGKINNKCL